MKRAVIFALTATAMDAQTQTSRLQPQCLFQIETFHLEPLITWPSTYLLTLPCRLFVFFLMRLP